MANVLCGKLLMVNGQRRISYPTKKGPMTQPTPFDVVELAASLASTLIPEDGLPVDLELELGKPVRIRPAGQPWGAVERPRGQSNRLQTGSDRLSPNVGGSRTVADVVRHFHNPYNFIPALPRACAGSPLGDGLPAGHDALLDNHWTGRIRVNITAVTPLLAVDASRAERLPNDHGIYPLRLDSAGNPYLPPTSLKGMLRAAYEAATNSRMGVLKGHQDRLAYRSAARTTTRPARVEHFGNALVLRLLTAVRLPRYEKHSSSLDHGEQLKALRYVGSNIIPQHGDHVYVLTRSTGVDVVVQEIRPWSAQSPGPGHKEGWVCVTGPNIKGKTCERVFVNDTSSTIPIGTDDCELWRQLIENYRAIHETEIEERRATGRTPWDYLGDTPGKTGFSRHIYEPGAAELQPGTLCYVAQAGGKVTRLYPVSISRILHESPPDALLSDELKPPLKGDALSPAERVFGWVNPAVGGEGAYRGCLRVGPIKLQASTGVDPAISTFPHPGIPLAILGQPKPQQARFYAAANSRGDAQPDGLSKEKAGYDSSHGLRGRKVYPHQRHAADYWTFPPHRGESPEYIRPGSDLEARDNQNRSILAWVAPGASFGTDLHITNLTPVELGALLWLLELPEGCYHRFGGGKSLGFGSVRVDINWAETDLRTGEEWRSFYRSLDRTSPRHIQAARDTITEYQNAVAEAYGDNSEFVGAPFIAAFLQSAKGFDDQLPTHYPRVTRCPQTSGENFKWFVANESDRQGLNRKLALRDLNGDPGLPLYEGDTDERNSRRSSYKDAGRGRYSRGG